MKTFIARLLAPLAVIFFAAACSHFHSRAPTSAAAAARNASPLPPGALVPSPRLIIGRVLVLDRARGFAFVDLAADPPADAVADGAELMTRTAGLRETARLRASPYLRGRTLGAKIVSGQPSPGDEVVWLAP